jgi:hypothetical protein
MENLVVRREVEESGSLAKKLPIMKTLASQHQCDVETLYSSVDASEVDVHDILTEMLSEKEVESSSGNARGGRFALTLKGWAEYLKVLGSIYELPE